MKKLNLLMLIISAFLFFGCGRKAWNLLPESERKLYLKTWNDNYWSWEK